MRRTRHCVTGARIRGAIVRARSILGTADPYASSASAAVIFMDVFVIPVGLRSLRALLRAAGRGAGARRRACVNRDHREASSTALPTASRGRGASATQRCSAVTRRDPTWTHAGADHGLGRRAHR